jgi:hypothetical protein
MLNQLLAIFINRAKAKLLDYILANYCMIDDVSPGVCRLNNKACYNTVHDAVNQKHNTIVMCWAVNDNSIFVHFINKTNEGRHVDNTLGVWCSNIKYYAVRDISAHEFWDVNVIYEKYKHFSFERLNWIERLVISRSWFK